MDNFETRKRAPPAAAARNGAWHRRGVRHRRSSRRRCAESRKLRRLQRARGFARRARLGCRERRRHGAGDCFRISGPGRPRGRRARRIGRGRRLDSRYADGRHRARSLVPRRRPRSGALHRCRPRRNAHRPERGGHGGDRRLHAGPGHRVGRRRVAGRPPCAFGRWDHRVHRGPRALRGRLHAR